MFKKNLIIFTLAMAFSSQSLAFWGDAVPGPQQTVPPIKLIQLASGDYGVYFPPIGPKPTVPPETRIILTSSQGGGFFPPMGPMPYPPIDELPQLLASGDGLFLPGNLPFPPTDSRPKVVLASDEEVLELEIDADIRTVGSLIEKVLTAHADRNLVNSWSDEDAIGVVFVLPVAIEMGIIETKTGAELIDMIDDLLSE